jgi:hypothetical protein
MELIERRKEDEQGEEDCKIDMELRALEEVDELHVFVWIGMIEDIGNTVVSPMVGHAWQDTACTPIHPSQQ